MDPRGELEQLIQEKAESIIGSSLPKQVLQSQGGWWSSNCAAMLHGKLQQRAGETRTAVELAAEITAHLEDNLSFALDGHEISGKDSVLVTKGEHKLQRGILRTSLAGRLEKDVEYSVALSTQRI
jgi:hypothetical protein